MTAMSVSHLVEKPTEKYASEHLHVKGVTDEYFTCFGVYLLSGAQIFSALDEIIALNKRGVSGKFELMDGLDRVRLEQGLRALVMKGRRFHIGSPQSYRIAVADYAIDLTA